MKDSRNFDMPAAEKIQQELATAESVEDFFGKEGIFSRLFANTINQMMKAELDNHLGYPKHSPAGYLTGNSRNGTYKRKLKTSEGELDLEVPRDRKGEFEPQIIDRYQTRTSEFDNKIIAMYRHGTTVADIAETMNDMYGIELSKEQISTITDKILPLVDEWRTRPLETVYPIVYLDCIHIKLRRDPQEIRRLIYTTNAVEGYNRMLRKVTKSKAVFPTENSVFKMFYLATKNVMKKWTMPIPDWGKILSQLSIRFEGRFSL